MGFTSFSIALSALSAHTTAIDVVGNNLANLNTTGFKESTVAFHDLVTQSMGAGLGGTTQVGFGVGTPVTIREFTQGAIQATSSPLDVAIQGDGFLIAHTTQGATQYTRGGNLVVDTAGNLTNATGDFIQGWGVQGGVVNTNAPVGNITLPVGALKAPVATANVSVDLNLNAAATAGPPPDSFSTSMQVYDSLGNTHVVTFNFTKTTTANAWAYTMSFPAGDTTAPSTPVTGTLQFDGNGNLTSPLPTDPPILLNVPGLSDGASDMNITWNLYNGATPRITQFTQPSATSALSQDGAAAANLVKVGISDGGKIVAQYSSGDQVTVGQLAMATIRNPESLLAVGNNNYALTAFSAIPAVGLPNTGGRGQLLGGSVEASTVDIAKEFTNLIVFQRGYEANARVVTTVDQLSQDTIALKPA
jgi:flagellar hook protein FlgE